MDLQGVSRGYGVLSSNEVILPISSKTLGDDDMD